jgi:hypothetical protein
MRLWGKARKEESNLSFLLKGFRNHYELPCLILMVRIMPGGKNGQKCIRNGVMHLYFLFLRCFFTKCDLSCSNHTAA